MKIRFVSTRSVKRFWEMVDHINHKLTGVERMALVVGECGLGKSETALKYSAENRAIMVRTIELMTGCWLLRKIVYELGGAPAHSAEKNIDMIGQLIWKSSKPRVIIIDEADRFAYKPALLETLRDLHDLYHVPVILIGEDGAEKKLMANRRLYRRFVDILHFEKLDTEGVKQFLCEVSDIRFEVGAVERISRESTGKISEIITVIHRMENWAKRNNAKSVGVKDLT